MQHFLKNAVSLALRIILFIIILVGSVGLAVITVKNLNEEGVRADQKMDSNMKDTESFPYNKVIVPSPPALERKAWKGNGTWEERNTSQYQQENTTVNYFNADGEVE
ncbi:unnamed protein product [Orchesella dallaii]|uniref:Uncharacterized protein n=1 Tax=Orchesella dallaii TaxID=48710 RepID=A0ABP1QNJ7_9HEXA